MLFDIGASSIWRAEEPLTESIRNRGLKEDRQRGPDVCKDSCVNYLPRFKARSEKLHNFFE